MIISVVPIDQAAANPKLDLAESYFDAVPGDGPGCCLPRSKMLGLFTLDSERRLESRVAVHFFWRGGPLSLSARPE